jgi:twitching motility protein PilU
MNDKQAPGVILMVQVRDRETMEHAIAFAETGHLCRCTLHANSANQALDRIINFFPEERRAQLLTDLSLNLKGMISQRLLPKQDNKGRTAVVGVMLNTPLISDLISKGDALENNAITYEEALRNADSVNDLRLQIKLSSKRVKSIDLAAGTENFAIV